MKNDYITVVYSNDTSPKTNYPTQLINYLITRFKLTTNKNILEIGCGRGDFLKAFNHAGFNCKGLDREQSSGVTICDVSNQTFPFENNSFDVVFHKSLIEHLYDPNFLMEETYRVLRPGGLVIILTPDWVSQMKVFYEDYTHSRPYNTKALYDLLKIKNFERVHTEIFYQLPIIWKYPILKIVSKVLQVFLSTPLSRKITKTTNIKFIRWSVELMVLGVGYKKVKE